MNKFQDALKKIDNSLPKVPAPVFTCSAEITQSFQGAWAVKYHGSTVLKVSLPESGVKVRVTKNEDPLAAKMFETVDNSPINITVTESCTYFMVTMNGQNEFSRVERISFTNLDDESKLILDIAPKLDRKEWIYRFKNPGDKIGLTVLLKDIIEHIKQDQIISDAEILVALEETIQAKFKK